VLFVHGQGSSQRAYEHRADMVSQVLDAICLTFDLSGHGNDAANSDMYSVYDHLQDVLAAYDYLASLSEVKMERMGICGASYGGYLAAVVTAHRAIRRLILRAPSLAKDLLSTNANRQLRFAKEVPEELDSIRILHRYSGEVLLVESEKDEVIPKSYIEAYLGACSFVQHKVILHAGHALTNPIWDEAFITAIKDWFEGL
jgi:pimeloyl-ACP methyl ester carboxylesterase